MTQPPTTAMTWRHLLTAAIVVALLGAGCSSSDDDAPGSASPSSSADPTAPSSTSPTTPTTTAAPEPAPAMPAEVSGPITAGAGPSLPQPAAPAPEGYVEEEFFFGGEATSYMLTGEPSLDGMWSAMADTTAPYQTRLLVRRPPAERFSGVVLVEWLNVTAGLESSPDWAYLSEEIGRSGHAYVAVSVQSQGVEGGTGILEVEVDEEQAAEAGTEGEVNTDGLVNADPERYGSLSHPGDPYAFDMYSQAGAAVRDHAASVLGGLEPSHVVAVGESQSAFFLTSYINAVHPLVDVYDGFLVHSRGGAAVPLDGNLRGDDADQATSPLAAGVAIRTDLAEPVFIFEAETDLTLLGYSTARQPDTETVRTWEVAGTAHADAHVIGSVLGTERDPTVGSFLGCDDLINTGPHHEVYQAALSHLVTWLTDGTAPPTGEPLEITDTEPAEIRRDDLGIALGGVRNPLVDVPVAVLSGDPPYEVDLDSLDTCALFGTTAPLDAATLIEIHGSADEYVAAFGAAADAAVEAGHLLPADAATLVDEAEANRALFG